MKAWQFFILLSVIINNGTMGEYRGVLAWVCLSIAVFSMFFPPKSEKDTS